MAVALLLLATPTQAGVITITGSIYIPSDYYTQYSDGVDHAGIFTNPGTSLEGLSFTVTWTTMDCVCSGGSYYGTTSPIISAVLQINGHNYDFGSGIYGYVGPDSQNVTVDLSYLAMNTYIPAEGQTLGGNFRIPTPGYTVLPQMGASGYFKIAPVPGPTAGSLYSLLRVLSRW